MFHSFKVWIEIPNIKWPLPVMQLSVWLISWIPVVIWTITKWRHFHHACVVVKQIHLPLTMFTCKLWILMWITEIYTRTPVIFNMHIMELSLIMGWGTSNYGRSTFLGVHLEGINNFWTSRGRIKKCSHILLSYLLATLYLSTLLPLHVCMLKYKICTWIWINANMC